MDKETLFAYSILLRVGLISIEQYNEWLDDAFQKNEENAILMELEFCFNDINKTVV